MQRQILGHATPILVHDMPILVHATPVLVHAMSTFRSTVCNAYLSL